MDHILYMIIIFKYTQNNLEYLIYSRLLWAYLKKHNQKINNPSIWIYVNKVENRITFKIKTGYYLDLLTPETMKLLWNSENKITKDRNGENVPYLEITEVALVYCNIVNNDYHQHSRVLYTFVPNKPFVSLLEFWPTNFMFLKIFKSEFQKVDVGFTDQ